MKQTWKVSKKILGFLVIGICCIIPMYGQSIYYSCMLEDTLYLGFKEKDGFVTDMVRAYDMRRPDIPSITYTPMTLNAFFPYCWKKVDNRVVLVYGNGNLPTRGRVSISKFMIEPLDSITKSQQLEQYLKELQQQYPQKEILETARFRRFAEQGRLRNTRVFSPVFNRFRLHYMTDNALQKATNSLSYDFIASDSSNFFFYVRADQEFTIWKYRYPDLGIASTEKDWEEVITYSADSLYQSIPNPNKAKLIPSGAKHKFRAIQDTLFFEGHFTVFKQGKNTFLLNRDYGGLYIIRESDIDKIGQIEDFSSYPNSVFGKKIFIEDKDNEQLILFANVRFLKKNLPQPKIKIIKPYSDLNLLIKELKS